MMHGIEDPKLRLARGVQNFQHMGDAVVGFGNSFDARPDLAAFGNEVVIRIDHQQRGDALSYVGLFMAFPLALAELSRLADVNS
jgi:hypothetical protein